MLPREAPTFRAAIGREVQLILWLVPASAAFKVVQSATIILNELLFELAVFCECDHDFNSG